jgi:hypothetical protein
MDNTLTLNEYIDKIQQLEPKPDAINPDHYQKGGIQTIDYIEAKLGSDGAFSYCLGNVIKYVSRAGVKDITKEREDLEKAKWYLDRALKYC